jgi:2-dehydro-3-deoxygalactonokinase
MKADPVVAAVDWGTTRMRIWLLGFEGAMLAGHHSDDGLTTAQTAGFATILERSLAALDAPAGIPVIICGMAGSRQGWREAPYVDTPCAIGAIFKGAVAIPDQRRDIRIIPGLAQRRADAMDVIRGEETQLAGAGLEATPRAVVCMPGTHSKWVLMEQGVVSGFGTWPTGELHAVLSKHSILRHSLGDGDALVSPDGSAFLDACAAALATGGDIISKLFSIRAGGLLAGLGADEAAASLSGLLIGGEIASALKRYPPAEGRVVLIASGALAPLYDAALRCAGLDVALIDADAAVQRGLFEAAQQNGMIERRSR